MKRGENKKGLSTIVITLILILLSLVAVGIVWFVVNNILKSGTQNIDIGTKCLNLNIEAVSANCSSGITNAICDVQIMRTGTSSDEIGGVKLVFKNTTSSVSSASVIDISGNIETLVGKRQTGIDTKIANADGVNHVEVTPYFGTSTNAQLCSQTTSFDF